MIDWDSDTWGGTVHLASDGSWLFSLIVALMVATVIIADDARRRPADASSSD